MDWANVSKHVLPNLPNDISLPDEHVLYKENIVTWNGELSKVNRDVDHRGFQRKFNMVASSSELAIKDKSASRRRGQKKN